MVIDEDINIYVGTSIIKKVYQGDEQIYSAYPYIPLLYIRSDHQQYIDTGVPCNQLGRIITKFKINQIRTYNWAMGGSGSTSGARSNSLGIGLSTAEANNGFCYSNNIFNYSFAAGNTYDISYTFKAGQQNIVINNSSYSSNMWGSITNAHLYLFAHDYYNWSKPGERSGIDLYETILYGVDQTTPIRDFIPVIEKETGVVCLYDKITQQFYYNLGTGSFIAGPEI